jgi:YebC/PmpR family DNA-binding regulatory protein
MNFQLRIAIDKAKAANMPKDNIQRAVDKATGAGGQATLDEVVYEAYGPGGTAFMIETASDNRNRTVGEIRATLNKFDGKLAETGSVAYLFKKRGVLVLEANDVEAAELAAIEAGAEDFEASDGHVLVFTDPKQLEAVRRSLAEQGLTANEASLEFHPLAAVPVTDVTLAKRVVTLSEALDELDDVVTISSNFDVDENLLQ